eukprot:616785-Rhodomonas_salina.4
MRSSRSFALTIQHVRNMYICLEDQGYVSASLKGQFASNKSDLQVSEQLQQDGKVRLAGLAQVIDTQAQAYPEQLCNAAGGSLSIQLAHTSRHLDKRLRERKLHTLAGVKPGSGHGNGGATVLLPSTGRISRPTRAKKDEKKNKIEASVQETVTL